MYKLNIKPTPNTHKIEVYQSAKDLQYYWRLKRVENGAIVATGNEPFVTKQNCKESAKKVATAFEDKTVDKSDLE